jgi:transcription-repair coupling factor (superfamily II helicase)
VIRLIQSEARKYRLDGQDKLRFNLDLADPEVRFARVHSLLDLLEPAADATGAAAPDHRPGTFRHAH